MKTMERKQPRPRRSFTPEFKAEVVELVRQPGHTVGSVARDLDLPAPVPWREGVSRLADWLRLERGLPCPGQSAPPRLAEGAR